MNLIKEINNTIEIIRIYDSNYHYSCGYYSNNIWVDENRFILSRSKKIEFNEGCELALIDILNGTEKILVDKCNGFIDYVVYNQILYYVSGEILYSLNIENSEFKEICRCPNMHFPHITNDGRYLNWEISPYCKCFKLDLKTGEMEQSFEKSFAPPFQYSDHMMICPTDPDKIFFAHEGDTFYVSNRLWLYEKDKGLRCIAKQNLTENGDLGDCFGHECWSPDGKGLYFVKYKCSPIPPRGICYVDLKGNQSNAIYSKYPYWHVSCSPCGRYLAADTQSGEYSGVCLIDKITNEEKMLIKANSNWQHPCHPHPSFSPKSKKLCFHDLYKDQITVGVINIK